MVLAISVMTLYAGRSLRQRQDVSNTAAFSSLHRCSFLVLFLIFMFIHWLYPVVYIALAGYPSVLSTCTKHFISYRTIFGPLSPSSVIWYRPRDGYACGWEGNRGSGVARGVDPMCFSGSGSTHFRSWVRISITF